MRQSHLFRSTAAIAVGAALSLAISTCNKSTAPTNTASTDASTADGTATMTSDTSGPAYVASPGYTQPTHYSTSAPPALPTYEQPPIPGPGYIWTPGYWAWSDDANDYYWAPGTWTRPPHAGLLWTPGYWRFINGRYGYSDGYWGQQVGFYGGVNYGYGYGGDGYQGGRWQGDNFYYNSVVNNLVGVAIGAMVYRQDVPSGHDVVSFNGGPGGIGARPNAVEIAAVQAPHVAPTGEQLQHIQSASANPALRASVNQGRPAIAATSRPGVFTGPGVVTNARAGAPYHPPAPAAGAMAAARPGEAPRPGQAPPAAMRAESPASRAATAEKAHTEPARAMTSRSEERAPQARPAEMAHTPGPAARPEEAKHTNAPVHPAEHAAAHPEAGPRGEEGRPRPQ